MPDDQDINGATVDAEATLPDSVTDPGDRAPDSTTPPGDGRTRGARLTMAAGLATLRCGLTLRWVPLTAALLSLALSLASIYVATRQPDVVLITPDLVRLAGGHQTGASYLYLQPAFVSTGNNDRIEVIRDMRISVQRDGGPPPVDMQWREQVRLVSGAAGAGLSYQHEADAVPLLISPKSAAAPLSLFQAPNGWFFEAGTYRFTLVADRVVVSDSLRASFTVVVGPEDLAVLDAVDPERFLAYPLR